MGFFGKLSQDKRIGDAIGVLSVAFFLFFVIGPLFFVFLQLGNFKFTTEMFDALALSFLTAAAVTAIDLLFGIPLAWALSHKNFPLKGLVDSIVDLPLLIPTSALGLSISLFYGQAGLGILQPGLGMIIALHIAFTFSYVVRTTQAAFVGIDSDLARASSTLGARPFTTFRTVWLPLARSGVISGAVLAFTRSLGETGATMIVAGATMTVPVLTVYFKNSAPPDMDAAISISAILLVISAALFTLVRQSGAAGRFRLGKIYADAEARLSGKDFLSDAAGIAFVFAIVLLPSFYFLRFADGGFFTQGTISAICVSFFVAGAATLLSIVFGLPLALLIAGKGKASGPLRLLVELSLLMPTVTIGLSLSLFWAGKLDEIAVLVLAHTAMVFAYFVSPVAETLSDMDRNLVEVARSLGADPLGAFRTVVMPLAMPTLIAGTVVAFMRSVSETGGTLAVSKHIETVPLLIVNLTKQGEMAKAASASVLLLAVSLALVAALRMSQKRRNR